MGGAHSSYACHNGIVAGLGDRLGRTERNCWVGGVPPVRPNRSAADIHVAHEAGEVDQVARFRVAISLGLYLCGAGSIELELADSRNR